MKYLDLSFNYLSGTVTDMTVYNLNDPYINNCTTLYLETNRLSGDIPNCFQDAKLISILTGNLFQCGINRNNLPKNDPFYTQYSCGSLILNASIASFATGVAILLVIASLIGIKLTVQKLPVNGYNNRHRTNTDLGNFSMKTQNLENYSNNEININNDDHGDINRPRIFTESVIESHNDSKDNNFMRSSSMKTSVIIKNESNSLSSNSSQSKLSFHRISTVSQLWLHTIYHEIYNIYYPKLSKVHDVPHTAGLFYILKALRTLSTFISFYSIFIFIPIYLIYKLIYTQYSNHTFNYGWIISVAFLQGISPTITVIVFWLILVLIVHICIIEMNESRLKVNKKINNDEISENIMWDLFSLDMSEQWRLLSLKSISAYALNCIIVVSANGAYVYITLTQDTAFGIVALISLVAFKTAWNLVIVPILLMDWFDRRKWCNGFFAVPEMKERKGTDLAHSLLLMFNNVVAPVI